MTTNDEPINNSQPIPKREIDWIKRYNLPYNKTEWGMFYEDYKDLGQLQLQKALEHNKNELILIQKKDRHHDRLKYCQHIFYNTEWDEKLEEFKTPDILKRHTKHGYDDTKWCDDYTKYKEVTNNTILAYYKRCKAEHVEVKSFYEQRKKELEITQKEEHKEHANEKVKCPFCQAEFARTNLARHKKTNKRCLEIQNKNNTEC
jgi:hypothetical protein